MCETKAFRVWHMLEIARKLDPKAKTAAQLVDEAMAPANLKVEGREDEQWVVIE